MGWIRSGMGFVAAVVLFPIGVQAETVPAPPPSSAQQQPILVDPAPAQPAPAPQPQPQPQPAAPAPGAAGPQPAAPILAGDSQPAPENPHVQGRGIEYGLHILVPIFLKDSEAIDMDPGIGIQGRIGWEFPAGVTAEVNLGGMVNGSSNADVVDDFTGLPIGEYTLTNVWLGGGIRYSFFNPSAFVPFVGAGLQLNVWSNAVDLDGGIESTEDDSVVTLGGNVLVGAAFEVNRWAAIEAGAIVNVTAQPEAEKIAAEPRIWISPFIGGTLYY